MKNWTKSVTIVSLIVCSLLLGLSLFLSNGPARRVQKHYRHKQIIQKKDVKNHRKISKNESGTITEKDLQEADASSCDNLMIVAHPDDEMLWGGVHLIHEKWFVVCITEGYNKTRSEEFKKVLKMTDDNGIILDYTDVRHHLRYDWKYNRKGIAKDVNKFLDFKDWKMIATHNPEGEYGHIHHILTNHIVTKKCKKNTSNFQKLYYFGRYYSKDHIPVGLQQIDKQDLEKKISILYIYKSQKKACMEAFRHTWPYENWQSAYDLYKNKTLEKVYPNIQVRKIQVKQKKLLQMEKRLDNNYIKKYKKGKKGQGRLLGREYLKKKYRIKKSLEKLQLKRNALKKKRKLRRLRLRKKRRQERRRKHLKKKEK